MCERTQGHTIQGESGYKRESKRVQQSHQSENIISGKNIRAVMTGIIVSVCTMERRVSLFIVSTPYRSLLTFSTLVLDYIIRVMNSKINLFV